MAIKGPKDRAQTEVTMLPRANRRRGLKLLQLTEPSALDKLSRPEVLLWNVSRPACLTSVGLCEAVTPQQVDAVGRSHVQVDVLQIEQDCKEQRPLQVLRLWTGERPVVGHGDQLRGPLFSPRRDVGMSDGSYLQVLCN